MRKPEVITTGGLSRRRFLGGAGTLVALPFLQSLLPREVRAAHGGGTGPVDACNRTPADRARIAEAAYFDLFTDAPTTAQLALGHRAGQGQTSQFTYTASATGGSVPSPLAPVPSTATAGYQPESALAPAITTGAANAAPLIRLPPAGCTLTSRSTPCAQATSMPSPDMPVRMTAITCEPIAWAVDSSMRSIEGTMPVPRGSDDPIHIPTEGAPQWLVILMIASAVASVTIAAYYLLR